MYLIVSLRLPLLGLEVMLDRYVADTGHYFSYPLGPDGWSICQEFRSTHWPERRIAEGVLADWLEDHREELLHGAVGPSDPAVRLDALIDHLRQKFRNVR